MKYHCLFEQSGTFKNEFIKLGYESYDYDILNDFCETDFQIDLYKEINNAYDNLNSIFDNFGQNDTIIAFFPCTRFENQILLWFRGDAKQQKSWNIEEKLQFDLKLHEELHNNFNLITKFVIICIRKKIQLIIENPYSEQHYLTKYWPIKPSIIDMDRRATGDYEKKPTQFWFINREPSHNFIFEGVYIKKQKKHNYIWGQVERSMISPDYANRFIREYIL